MSNLRGNIKSEISDLEELRSRARRNNFTDLASRIDSAISDFRSRLEEATTVDELKSLLSDVRDKYESFRSELQKLLEEAKKKRPCTT